NALKKAGAESSPINDGIVQQEPLHRGPVEHAPPLAVPAVVKPVWMLEAQQGLGRSVACLLAEIGARTLAPVVPDKRARRERDPLPGLLQPPAHVDVIARLAILWIETVDGLQGLTAKGHVAARNVFGDLVALEYVGRLPRAGSHAGAEPTVLGRQVRSAHGRRSAPLELVDKVREPAGVGEAVRVGVGDDFPVGRLEADV